PTGILYIAVRNGRALSSAGERSLHTGEVVGSIPTAPTIFQSLIGSVGQLTTEHNEKTTIRFGENPGTLFALCLPLILSLQLTIQIIITGVTPTPRQFVTLPVMP